MSDTTNRFPPGWDDERVRRVIDYYDSFTDEEWAEEDEAAFADKLQTAIMVPNEMVPAVVELLSKHDEVPSTTITLKEVERPTGGGNREKDLAAYLESVNSLSADTAGRVVPAEGETLTMVRRRLGDAARMSGRDIEIKRTENAVYYWLKEGRRRGRPRTRREWSRRPAEEARPGH